MSGPGHKKLFFRKARGYLAINIDHTVTNFTFIPVFLFPVTINKFFELYAIRDLADSAISVRILVVYLLLSTIDNMVCKSPL